MQNTIRDRGSPLGKFLHLGVENTISKEDFHVCVYVYIYMYIYTYIYVYVVYIDGHFRWRGIVLALLLTG